MKKRILSTLAYWLGLDLLFDGFIRLIDQARAYRLGRKLKRPLTYIGQGSGGLTVDGDISMFAIDPTSHLKSNTYIGCAGGVKIGRYFHVGRGLTILSTNHDYRNSDRIPYDDEDLLAPVEIKDFVWCGMNVTILPGVTVGEGAIIGACSVVTKDVPDCAVVVGNPARVIKYRDREKFYALKEAGRFY